MNHDRTERVDPQEILLHGCINWHGARSSRRENRWRTIVGQGACGAGACHQLRRWWSLSDYGTWYKTCSLVIGRTKLFGSSRQTANTQQNRHMMSSLKDLSVHSGPIGFGLRTLSLNTVSSPGYYCKRRFSQQTNCKRGIGPATLYVHSAAWHQNRHSIFAYNAHLRNLRSECGSLCRHGRATSFPS